MTKNSKVFTTSIVFGNEKVIELGAKGFTRNEYIQLFFGKKTHVPHFYQNVGREIEGQTQKTAEIIKMTTEKATAQKPTEQEKIVEFA